MRTPRQQRNSGVSGRIGLNSQLHGVSLAPIFLAMPCLQGVAGVYFFGGLGSVPDTRVVVYIDYQNVYHGTRELFCELNIGRGGRGQQGLIEETATHGGKRNYGRLRRP